MKPRKPKSSDELEQYIAELQEQVRQAKLDKKEALAREREQARKWRSDLLREIGGTLLSVVGCDWTLLDLGALREWLLNHAGEMQTLTVASERTPEEAHDALLSFRHGLAADTKDAAQEIDSPQEEPKAADPTDRPDDTTGAEVADGPSVAEESDDFQNTPWTPQGETWQPQQGWN